MSDPKESEQKIEDIDESVRCWRQGDFVKGSLGFVVRFNPRFPLGPFEQEEPFNSDLYEQNVEGLVILTQTCDIVRESKNRPYVEVAPLVTVKDAERMQNIQRGAMPRYAFVSGAASQMLVADLDRVMTVEKGLLASWTQKRERGCLSDQDQRDFAEALARKRSRFAFPDDFVSWIGPLQSRITQKHGKNSYEGECLRTLREIRVAASPSWDAKSVSLMFWFIVGEYGVLNENGLQRQCNEWMDGLNPAGRFLSIDYELTTLDNISAKEYLCSDRLDLDHLSKGH